jgi:hypothetical protein
LELCNEDTFSDVLLDSDYLSQYVIDESAPICISLVIGSKGNLVQNEYFDYLQRGGLCIPTDITKLVLFHISAVFEQIINDSAMEFEFLNISNQKSVSCELALISITKDPTLNDFFAEGTYSMINKD